MPDIKMTGIVPRAYGGVGGVLHLASLTTSYLFVEDQTMYTFSDEVPDDPKGRVFDLVRVKQQGYVRGIITSDRSLSQMTHFWGGRTMPHPDEDCPACAEGMAYRWHTYFAFYSVKLKLPFLFECTSAAAGPLKLYLLTYGSLRGCEFNARRLGTRANSRVLIETQPANLETTFIPKEPNLRACLCRIWNVPYNDTCVGRPHAPEPILHVDRIDGDQDITRPRIHSPAGQGNGEPAQ